MDSLSYKNLLSIAKSNGLKGYSRMNKQQLVKFCMKCKSYSSEEGLEEFDGEINGKPYFRKYVDYGINEITISRILKNHPHPNIVSIFDIGPNYIDMQLLKTRITIKDVSLSALRRAKDFMHSLGIVYLDWKIDNLGLDDSGNIKIFDFDLSARFIKDRFTETPEVKGYYWRDAEEKGLRTPIEIDDWIFNNAF